MVEATEGTPLQAKRPDASGPGAWLCCRTLAPIEVRAMQLHRHAVLTTCLAMAGLGAALAAVGFLGGFSSSKAVLMHAPWIVVDLQHGTKSYAGVKYVCTDFGPFIGVRCKSWSNDDMCDGRIVGGATEVCEACQSASTTIAFSVFLALLTYLTFAWKTYQRCSGADSPCVKFVASFVTLVGAVNFLTALSTYKMTCIAVAETDPRVDVHVGLGFHCLVIATVLKVIMGGLHLCLPVEPPTGEAKPAMEVAQD